MQFALARKSQFDLFALARDEDLDGIRRLIIKCLEHGCKISDLLPSDFEDDVPSEQASPRCFILRGYRGNEHTAGGREIFRQLRGQRLRLKAIKHPHPNFGLCRAKADEDRFDRTDLWL